MTDREILQAGLILYSNNYEAPKPAPAPSNVIVMATYRAYCLNRMADALDQRLVSIH